MSLASTPGLRLASLSAALLFTLAPNASAQVTFTVNSTADPGDGTCDAAECTLREALVASEATPAVDFVHFDVPGAGVHTIALQTLLPFLAGSGVVIDGYTQPGAAPNTNGPDEGTNAVIRIELVPAIGTNIPFGLGLCRDETVVRGLAVGGFSGHGISVGGFLCGASVVEGCFVGTDATGTVAHPNGGNGVLIEGGANNRIGGTAPAARNVLSGNARYGVAIATGGTQQPATGSVIQGNLIGTDASGAGALPNGSSFPGLLGGVGVEPNLGSVTGTLIGGTAPGAGNVIAGNVGFGLRLLNVGTAPGAVDIRVEGNRIGTDVTGTQPLPNTSGGVAAFRAGIAIGGTAAGAGNVIANNGGPGITIQSGTDVRVLGNAVFSNAGLGIDLDFPDGVPLPNDPGDTDEGPNRLQNYPEIASASLTGAGLLAATYAVDTDPANAAYPLRVEFFRADVGGEGEALLGSDTYTASDYSGCGSAPCLKAVTFVPAGPVTDAVVATATDEMGNTSEFTADAAIVVAHGGDAPGMPAALALSEASPNPLASRTTLRYEVAASGPVRLAVYDLLGREVAVLVEDARVAGVHEVTLEAEGLSPGLYVVRLQVGTSAVSRRVVIAR